MRYFFVGIGGVSMSALAKLLHYDGAVVAGSDVVASANTRELQALGCQIYIGHQAKNIGLADCLVVNGAIAANNPELLAAKKAGIKIIYRETLLAQIARRYQEVLAVAGCHGKSSTTALFGQILQLAGRQPTIHNGAQQNLQLGEKKYFVTEACEFRKSFLKLKPRLAIITNVDADHLDCYQDLTEIKKCFAKFAAQSMVLIKNAEDVNSADLFGREKTVTFGLTRGQVHTKNLRARAAGNYEFDLVLDPQVFGQYYALPHFVLTVPGRHQVQNALAAIAGALILGVNIQVIAKALREYHGIARRFQTLGALGGTKIILDYAHHPRELAATIQTANKLYRRYLLVFQPHTYTRTLGLWSEFLQVLQQVPSLVLYKTYAAREKTIIGGRALDLARALPVKYLATPERLKNFLREQAAEFDAIILCGAGDIGSGEFLRDCIDK